MDSRPCAYQPPVPAVISHLTVFKALRRGFLLQLVSLAESISSPRHSRVAIVLTLLADIMAHTQRVTLAEGLYR